MRYKPKDGSKGRKRDAQPLKDVMQELLETYRLQGKYLEQKVVAAWPAVMGKFIDSKTTRVFVINQVLHVELSSAALKEELMMSRDRLIKLLNDHVGGEIIKEVRML